MVRPAREGEAEWRPTVNQMNMFRTEMRSLDFDMPIDPFYEFVRSRARVTLLWDYFIGIYEYFNQVEEPADEPTVEDLEILHAWYRVLDKILENNNNPRQAEMFDGLFTRVNPPPQ